VEVLVDGGFRRGADVVKAVALGAERPWSAVLGPTGSPLPASRAWSASWPCFGRIWTAHFGFWAALRSQS